MSVFEHATELGYLYIPLNGREWYNKDETLPMRSVAPIDFSPNSNVTVNDIIQTFYGAPALISASMSSLREYWIYLNAIYSTVGKCVIMPL